VSAEKYLAMSGDAPTQRNESVASAERGEELSKNACIGCVWLKPPKNAPSRRNTAAGILRTAMMAALMCQGGWLTKARMFAA